MIELAELELRKGLECTCAMSGMRQARSNGYRPTVRQNRRYYKSCERMKERG